MKSVLLICILILAIAFQTAKSQQESGWIDKGEYFENKYKISRYIFAQFSPDKKTILTYSRDKKVRIWDTETGVLRKELNFLECELKMFNVSKDNRYFAYLYDEASCLETEFSIFDIDSEKHLCDLNIYIPTSPAGTFYYHRLIKNNPSNNNFIISSELQNYYGAGMCGNEGINGEYSMDSCKYIYNLSGLIPYNIDLSSDGKKFIISGYVESFMRDDYFETYSYSYFLLLYNFETPDTAYTLDYYYQDNPNNVPNKTLYWCFSPDSKQLAIFRDGKIYIYDASNGYLLRTIEDNNSGIWTVYRVMYSLDMNYLIKCGNEEGIVFQFISIRDGKTKSPIIINSAHAMCADQSNDSTCFVIGTSDGRLLLIKDIYSDIIEHTNQPIINLIYPNPTNDKAQVNFSLAENSSVKIILFDFMGNEIKTIIDDNRNEGDYVKSFDTGFLTEGMYFLKLQTGTATSLFKLMINR